MTRILIIVQNLPVPFDRRVWLECQALVSDGHEVAVVCPKGEDDPDYEVLDHVELYKYRGYAPGGSKLGYLMEYAYSLTATAWLTLKARRRGRFGVMQACNPPDIFWPIALVLRVLDRTRFVFDHHDLCPELYESRFPDGPRLPYQAAARPSPTSPWSAAARTRRCCAVALSTPNCAAAAGSWPPTSASWDHRTAWTTWCGPPTSW